MTEKDAVWRENYEALKRYVLERGHLPDKHVVENRALLNWALCCTLHNGQSTTARKSKPERLMLTRCSSSRNFWHFAATNTPAAASPKTPCFVARIAQNIRHSGVKMTEALGILRYH